MMTFSGIHLVMAVIVIAASAMFIVFACSRLVFARIHLAAASRRFVPTAPVSEPTVLDHGLYGLVPAVLESFPTKKFGDMVNSYGPATQCTVCLEEYQDRDLLRILPSCNHAFHVTCINMWLQQHSTCPVCRISLSVSPGSKCMMIPLDHAVLRPIYPAEMLFQDSYHHLIGGHEQPAATLNGESVESLQEDQVTSEPSVAREKSPVDKY